jgi:hypothetical protein
MSIAVAIDHQDEAAVVDIAADWRFRCQIPTG